MPVASIAGISTHYQMIGEGPPLMVLEPEGFDSAMSMPSGATGTQLMAMAAPVFIMPGNDASHSASCAQILHELIPQATLFALGPRQQNAASIEQWIYSSIGMHGPAQRETAA